MGGKNKGLKDLGLLQVKSRQLFPFHSLLKYLLFFFKKISSELLLENWCEVLCIIYTETVLGRKPYNLLPKNYISLYLVTLMLLIEMFWQKKCFIIISLFRISLFCVCAAITNFNAIFNSVTFWQNCEYGFIFFHIVVCF